MERREANGQSTNWNYIIIIMVGRRLLRGWRMAGQGRAAGR